MQRFVCLCLPRAEIKGVQHHLAFMGLLTVHATCQDFPKGVHKSLSSGLLPQTQSPCHRLSRNRRSKSLPAPRLQPVQVTGSVPHHYLLCPVHRKASCRARLAPPPFSNCKGSICLYIEIYSSKLGLDDCTKKGIWNFFKNIF